MAWMKKMNIKGTPGTTTHAGLTDVTPDQHHTRFTAVEVKQALGARADSNQSNHNKYTDEDAAQKIARDALYLPLAGGTMTGPLDIGGYPISYTPRINFDNGTAKWTVGAFPDGGWYVKEGATTRMTILPGGDFDMPGNIFATQGTVALPAYSFHGFTSTGMYYQHSILGFSIDGTPVFTVKPGTPGNADIRLSQFRNCPTTGSPGNMMISTGTSASGRDRMYMSTSARRFKSNIEAAPQLADYVLEPVTFHHEGDGDDYLGFIADDVAAQDRRIGVYMDDEILNYDVRAVVAILAAKVNRLEGKVVV